MTQSLQPREVFAGGDTHADSHHAAVIDAVGRQLADRQFATIPARLPSAPGLGAQPWRGPKAGI